MRARCSRALRSGACWAAVMLLLLSFALLMPDGGDLEAAASDELIALDGRPTLLVSDSMGQVVCPWPVDRIAIPGKTAPELASAFRAHVAGRNYRQIALWPGNAHFSLGHDPTSYVRAVVDMATVAREHAESVVVLGPLPYTQPQQEWFIQATTEAFGFSGKVADAAHVFLQADTRAQVASGIGLLRVALADIPIYDGGQFRARVDEEGELATYYRDGFHPTDFGYRLIWSDLASMGHRLQAPDPATQLYFSLRARITRCRTRWFRFLWLKRQRIARA